MVRSTDLEESFKDTARCVEFFDRLFDCLNSSGYNDCKPYRRPLTDDSIHHDFLIDALKTLSRMEYAIQGEQLKKHERLPATLKNLIVTIKNVRHIQKLLSQKGTFLENQLKFLYY